MNKLTYVSFHKVGRERSSGRTVGGQFCRSFVANVHQYLCAKNYGNMRWFDKVIAKIKGVQFFYPIVDVDSIQQDLLQSELISQPPPNVDDFFTCYDDVLHSLINKHAPMKSVIIRSRAPSPWYDGDCRDLLLEVTVEKSLSKNLQCKCIPQRRQVRK